MERMGNRTKQPVVLRELFTALGNDPFVIAECLARPILAERRVDELAKGYDQRGIPFVCRISVNETKRGGRYDCGQGNLQIAGDLGAPRLC